MFIIAALVCAPLGLGANVRAGAIIPTNKLHTNYVVGVEIRERLPVLKRALGFSVDFGFFRPTLSGGGTDASVSGPYSYDVAARAFQLGVDVMGFVPVKMPIDIYAGVGYSAFVYAVTANAFNTTSSEFQTRGGLRVRAGVAWPFWGPLYVAAEAAYHYATFGFDITGQNNAGSFAVYAQVGFEL